LFGLAVRVVSAKLGGLIVERLGQPSVLGELLFGILLANLFREIFELTRQKDPVLVERT